MVIKEGRFGRFLACTNYPEHKETKPLPEELPRGVPEEKGSHGVVMQLRTGRFGPFYPSTPECGETKPFAKKVGVLCPVDGGEILEKHSRKGKEFFGCANWPNCDWVSWNRPLLEPCPQCGGLQVDMGRGRVRCLRHEGEPPRFVRNEPANGTTNGKVGVKPAARKKTATGKATAKTTRAKAVTATNGTVRKVAPKKPARAAAKRP